MNTTVKVLIGAAVGAAVGWFVGAVVSECMILLEEEEILIDLDEEDVEESEEEESPVEMSKKPNKKGSAVNYGSYFTQDDKEDLLALAARYNLGAVPAGEPNPGEAWEDEDGIDDEEDDPDAGPIRIISREEFAVSDTGYEQVTLTYYDDDVVCDDKNKPIHDPEALIGEEALVSFGMLSGSEDVVYIRNDDKKMEYEITKADRAFAQLPPRRQNILGKQEKHYEGEEDS